MTIASSRLTIGALSRRSGCNIETIRYYERAGLMPAPPRSQGGHRLYDGGHEKRLVFIRRSRELGFAVEQVRELLRLVDGGDYTCAEVKATTLAHLESVRGKIADLMRMASVLKDMAARCDGGEVPDCPIVEALFNPGR
jgi:MerR family mercuric resistance operon transcriptional regulator